MPTLGTIVATLQQPIGDYFQQSHIASYVGTSYLLSICCFTPLYGRLSDILGRKVSRRLGHGSHILTIVGSNGMLFSTTLRDLLLLLQKLLALSLFTTGTLLCGVAPSMKTLIAARAIAGMGGGG
jgi:MFS family permease